MSQPSVDQMGGLVCSRRLGFITIGDRLADDNSVLVTLRPLAEGFPPACVLDAVGLDQPAVDGGLLVGVTVPPGPR
jgi:hypothetical protein